MLTNARWSAVCVLASIGWFARPLEACTCSVVPKPCEEFNHADTVFFGQVTGVQTVMKEHRGGQYYARQFRFAVERIYKGGETRELEIATGGGGGDCGWPFEEGTRYLVYAFRNGDL